jgi:hypothetical protein
MPECKSYSSRSENILTRRIVAKHYVSISQASIVDGGLTKPLEDWLVG